MSEYRVVTDHTEDGFRFVSAVCGGFVFQVEAVRQPKIVAAELGGDWLVTVMAPWPAAYAFQGPEQGDLFWSYVWEKLGNSNAPHDPFVNALGETVGLALGRRYLPKVDE